MARGGDPRTGGTIDYRYLDRGAAYIQSEKMHSEPVVIDVRVIGVPVIGMPPGPRTHPKSALDSHFYVMVRLTTLFVQPLYRFFCSERA
jgi:hypothetical protein